MELSSCSAFPVFVWERMIVSNSWEEEEATTLCDIATTKFNVPFPSGSSWCETLFCFPASSWADGLGRKKYGLNNDDDLTAGQHHSRIEYDLIKTATLLNS